jgi:predicted AAA+ superfamily ATPase
MNGVRDVLTLQKMELEKRLHERYVERDTRLTKANDNLVRVVIGPRRAGKSFFTAHWLKQNAKFGYINFDDEKLVTVKDFNELLAITDTLYDLPEVLMLDEIQNVDKWELIANRLQREGRKLFITGSNSNLLSKELATHLTGRHLQISIFPFSFSEYIQFQNESFTEVKTKEKLIEYATKGGYPEPIVKNIDYKEYLSALLNSIIYKDIVKRHKIRKPNAIEDLTLFLLSNVGSEYSYQRLTELTQSKSAHTVQKYLNYLEEAFVLFSLKRFSYKTREQITSNKKIYAIDNGFIGAKSSKTTPDLGKLYENIVAIHLKKAEIDGKLNVYYWKSQQHEEVDFVIKEGLKISKLIQVCYDASNSDTRKREIRALIKAKQEFKCNELLILTHDYENKEEVEWYGEKAKIQFIPLWKWLLEKQ